MEVCNKEMSEIRFTFYILFKEHMGGFQSTNQSINPRNLILY